MTGWSGAVTPSALFLSSYLPPMSCRAQATRGPAPRFGLPRARRRDHWASQPPRTVPARVSSRHRCVSLVPVASDSACPSQGAFSPLKPLLTLGGECSLTATVLEGTTVCHTVWPLHTHSTQQKPGKQGTPAFTGSSSFSLLGILPAFGLIW